MIFVTPGRRRGCYESQPCIFSCRAAFAARHSVNRARAGVHFWRGNQGARTVTPPASGFMSKDRNLNSARGTSTSRGFTWGRLARGPLLALLISAVVVGAYFLWHRDRSAEPSRGGRGGGRGGGPISIVTATAEQRDLGVYLNGIGTVVPLSTVTVRTRVDGQLTAVHFTEGRTVQAGELLAEVDPRPFQAQLAQARGQLARDEAQLKNAELDLGRYARLVKDAAVPQQQFDTQQALVNQYQGNVLFDRGQIDGASVQLAYCRITSPITGRVGLRAVDAGNIVHTSDQNGIVVITQIAPISVIFTLAEDHLPEIRAQLKDGATLPVEAYDRELRNKLADGKLLTLNNQIDPTTGTLRFKAAFENADESLFPRATSTSSPRKTRSLPPSLRRRTSRSGA